MNKKHFAAAAAHHEAMFKAHTEMASKAKSKHDSLDDGDVHKAFYATIVETETGLAKSEKAMFEHNTAMAAECEKSENPAPAPAPAPAPVATATSDFIKIGTTADGHDIFRKATDEEKKAAGAPAPTTEAPKATSLDEMMESTKKALVEKALSSLTTDDTVAAAIKEMVLDQVAKALGDKMIPTNVRSIIPDAPGGSATPKNKLVPRAGEQPIDTSNLDPELAYLVNS